MQKAITIDTRDNIAVCLTDLASGESVNINGNDYVLAEAVKAKHKFGLKEFQEGDDIIMYGVLVGAAVTKIALGAAITTENIVHKTSEFGNYGSGNQEWNAPDVSAWEKRSFMGYHRSDGQVGTKNYWLVFPLVFCENRNIEVLKAAFYKVLGFEKKNQYEAYLQNIVSRHKNEQPGNTNSQTELQLPMFENVDGIKFLTHQGGCGGTREDSETLCRLLAGYANNPNVAGATVLSLGCQHAQIDLFKKCMDDINPTFDKPLHFIEQQKSGTEEKLMEEAISKTFTGLIEANKKKRAPASLDKLSIGLECGGSDGFSGISANPTLGRVSDVVTAIGGTAILSEFPELCGVENELIGRISSPEKSEKFISLMRHYEKAANDVGSGFEKNPSPGNIKEGLITDAIKSAGAAKKGGSSTITDVLDYTEYAYTPGLNLLCTPGNDVESTTGLAGSGANIILFTTGLGTPTGNPICPVIKVSTNSHLFEKMPDIIDYDAGAIIHEDKSIETLGDELLELVIEIASGTKESKAGALQQDDFIPWKRGVSL